LADMRAALWQLACSLAALANDRGAGQLGEKIHKIDFRESFFTRGDRAGKSERDCVFMNNALYVAYRVIEIDELMESIDNELREYGELYQLVREATEELFVVDVADEA